MKTGENCGHICEIKSNFARPPSAYESEKWHPAGEHRVPMHQCRSLERIQTVVHLRDAIEVVVEQNLVVRKGLAVDPRRDHGAVEPGACQAAPAGHFQIDDAGWRLTLPPKNVSLAEWFN